MLYLTILCIFIYFYPITKKEDTYFLFSFFLLICIILSALRYGSGIDYWGYYIMFNRAPSNVVDIHPNLFLVTEPTFLFFASICKQLHAPFQFLIIVYSTLSLVILHKSIKLFSSNCFFSLFIFFCNYYLVYIDSAIRQGMAIVIFIYAFFRYVKRRKILEYFFFVIIAIFCHYSAVILLFVPLALKLNKYLFTSFFSFILIATFCIIVGSILPNILLQLVASIFPRYLFYDSFSVNYSSIVFKFFMTLAVLVVYHGNKSHISKDIESAVILYIWGSYVFFMLSSISIFSRLVEYFFALEIIFLPALLINVGKYKLQNKIYKFLFCCMFSFLFLKDIDSFISIGSYFSNKVYDYPYVSIFNKEDYEKYRDYPDLEGYK